MIIRLQKSIVRMNYGRHLFQILLISEAKDSVRINRLNDSFNCVKVSCFKKLILKNFSF